MSIHILDRRLGPGDEPIEGDAHEQEDLRHVEEILQLAYETPSADRHLSLLGINGETTVLPEAISRLLQQAVPHLLLGRALAIVPIERELTTQQAADLLNVSRPFLIGLLEEGDIPHVKTGKHRRVRLEDILRYKKQRDATRREALDRLSELSQEYGLDKIEE
jgi:excisionase family DNA binding protein